MKKIYIAGFAALALFFIYSCGDGNKPAATTTSADTGGKPAATDAGKDVYMKTCVACHQADGGGINGSFPPLAKSDYLADKQRAIEQVLKGKSGEMKVNGMAYNGTMPPQPLNDDEIAAVLTYVYSNFGNAGGAVTAAEVKAVRDKK
jgi:mono/diheme cytochrome c family protein